MGITMRKSIISLILAGGFIGTAWADTLQLQDNVPDRYVVVKGDTLWDISGRFLTQPWRWPEIWQLNKAEIKDPHWIYPGDTIVLDRSGATPALKLVRAGDAGATNLGIEKRSPQIRTSPIGGAAIASISPSAIEPFLKQSQILDADTFNNAPRVAASHEVRTMFGAGDTVYAVDLKAKKGESWQVFRNGKELRDPDTQAVIGYEVDYLGDATVQAVADVSTLLITRTKAEIAIGDRLVRNTNSSFVNYAPHLPEKMISAKVVSAFGADAGAGTYSTVVINRGADDGIDVGTVLFSYKQGVPVKKELDTEPNRVTPLVKSGNMFIYRVFPKLSYGLLLDNTLPVNVGDEVKNEQVAGGK